MRVSLDLKRMVYQTHFVWWCTSFPVLMHPLISVIKLRDINLKIIIRVRGSRIWMENEALKKWMEN